MFNLLIALMAALHERIDVQAALFSRLSWATSIVVIEKRLSYFDYFRAAFRYIFMYIFVYICMYMYMYVLRERERMCIHTNDCLHTYVHACVSSSWKQLWLIVFLSSYLLSIALFSSMLIYSSGKRGDVCGVVGNPNAYYKVLLRHTHVIFSPPPTPVPLSLSITLSLSLILNPFFPFTRDIFISICKAVVVIHAYKNIFTCMHSLTCIPHHTHSLAPLLA